MMFYLNVTRKSGCHCDSLRPEIKILNSEIWVASDKNKKDFSHLNKKSDSFKTNIKNQNLPQWNQNTDK